MKKPIVINNWPSGVGASAFTGFQEIRGLNIIDKPGIIYPNKELVSDVDTDVIGVVAIDNLIIDMKKEPVDGYIYGVSGTKFYRRIVGGEWYVITGHGSTGTNKFVGLSIWRNYVFLIHEGGSVDLYDISNLEGWTNHFSNAWAALGGSVNLLRPSVIVDDKIYIINGNGNYGIGEIKEVDGETFNPDSATTYTVTAVKLDLPKDVQQLCIGEVSGRLLAGTLILTDDTKATIYPWDYASEAVSFDRPIELGVDGVYQMLTKNNLAYVHAGKNGEIFTTSGSIYSEPFAKIPNTLTTLFESPSYLSLYSEAFKAIGNEVLIGIGCSGAVTGANAGIYSLNLLTRGLTIKNVIPSGETGENDDVKIGCIMPIDSKNYLVSYYDKENTAYSVARVGTAGITSDRAYFITQFFNLGMRDNKQSVKGLELQLAKPLASGDSVKVYYRTAQNASWTAWGVTWSYNASLSEQSFVFPALTDIQSIQIKIVLNNSVELLSATIF